MKFTCLYSAGQLTIINILTPKQLSGRFIRTTKALRSDATDFANFNVPILWIENIVNIETSIDLNFSSFKLDYLIKYIRKDAYQVILCYFSLQDSIDQET